MLFVLTSFLPVSVYDCQVGSWGDWSPCSTSCGRGTQERRREVLRPDSNGGVSCPDLRQTKQCQVECQLEEDATDRQQAVRLSGQKHKSQQAVRGEKKRKRILKKLTSIFQRRQ